MEYAPRLPFGAPLTSWGISTIMIIGSLAISANKRNISKDKRTVPLSSGFDMRLSSVINMNTIGSDERKAFIEKIESERRKSKDRGTVLLSCP